MRTRLSTLLLVGALAVTVPGTPCESESYLPDDVSVAIQEAGRALSQGASRSKVLAEYRAATGAVRDSDSFRRNGAALLADLEASVDRRPGAAPETRLLDSRWRPRVWRPEDGERRTLSEMFREHPDDPAKVLLSGDRTVIGRLLPLLGDRAPTRAYGDDPLGEYPVLPRVCDLAVSILQFHGRVWFFDQFAFRELLHQRGEEVRARVVSSARAWWAETKEQPVAEGIRRLIPTADFYEKASMAENLLLLGRETADRVLEAEGHGVLREMFEDSERRQGHLGAYLARTLERYGDTSPVEEVYRRLAATRGTSGHHVDPGLVFYLIKHAQRREWELLTALAGEGHAGAGDSSSAVGTAIVNSSAGETDLRAVPALALALDRVEESGSRSVPGLGAQSYSLADKAVEQIQSVTGVDFGYRTTGTPAERRESIERARKWWREEGAARYTFDGIEAMLQGRARSGDRR